MPLYVSILKNWYGDRPNFIKNPVSNAINIILINILAKYKFELISKNKKLTIKKLEVPII